MKDPRLGEALWEEWEGEYYQKQSPSNNVYYTIEHIDITNEVIRKALAYALQRDGVAASLAEGFRFLEESTSSHVYIGQLDDEYLVICSPDGVTKYGDKVENIKQATFIEF